ncbi:RNA polymerase sigma factor [Fulvivirga sp. 29W222]|uniref:RNA polymerase sigma factor n=1 Tax=Fulvivirga marina TaxID=2494733 RepID=A0A937G3M5_9BACT|nr:RNA polymerase sigma factor [Fulvivirga marina]MBL6449423.1 RNA polymerase sigma factor [Fulvivirga marina]
MDSEKALIEGCCKGDRKSQKQLFDLYSKKMMVVAMRYSKSDQEAEDILQESFIKIFEKIKTFRGEARLDFWVKRIVINTALNHQRSKLYLFPMVDVHELNFSEESSFSLADFHFRELLKMIQELPSGCQVIFNLFAVEGYSHKEIAQLLNISEGTSKSQYARAKSLLRDKIETEESISYGNAR